MAPSPLGSPELSITKPAFKYQDAEGAVDRFALDQATEQSQENQSSTTDAVETSSAKPVDLTQKTVIEGPHDVPYFRLMLEREFSRIDSLCEQWKYIEQTDATINDDGRGQVLSAVGKAQLLITQRMDQFLGLVNDCEANTGEKPINCTDLDGFWDMVDLQIDDVNRLFRELIALRANHWLPISPPKPAAKPARKPLKRRTNKTEVAAKKDAKPKVDRAAQRRKMMAEARAKQKALAEQKTSSAVLTINGEELTTRSEVENENIAPQPKSTPGRSGKTPARARRSRASSAQMSAAVLTFRGTEPAVQDEEMLDSENIAPLPKKTPRKSLGRTPRRSARISLLYTPNNRKSTAAQMQDQDLMSFTP